MSIFKRKIVIFIGIRVEFGFFFWLIKVVYDDEDF